VVVQRKAEPELLLSRSVLWLSSSQPPTALAPHLRRHGLSLEVQRTQTWPCARITALEARAQGAPEQAQLRGRRLAVLHSDPGEADALSQVLRNHGADAVVVGLKPDRLERVEAFEPDAVLVENESFYGASFHMVRALWKHTRLRWLPMVLLPGERSRQGSFALSDLSALSATLRNVLATWDEVRVLALTHKNFHVPMHALGPLRTLRALLRGEGALRASFLSGGMRVEVDIMGSQVVALRGRSLRGGPERTLDKDGLKWLMEREQGTVEVEPAPQRASLPPPGEARFAAPPSSGVRPALQPRDDDPTTVHRPVKTPLPSLPPQSVQRAPALLAPSPQPRHVARLPAQTLSVARSFIQRPGLWLGLVLLLIAGVALLSALGFPLASALHHAHKAALSSVRQILHTFF
jgi:hypothetical protein